MATLICEDEEYITSLAIEPGRVQTIDVRGEKQNWQHIRLILRSGDRELVFATEFKEDLNLRIEDVLAREVKEAASLAKAVLDIQAVADAYVLCRSPKDEVKTLVKHLSELGEGKRAKVLFEPYEPSFELSAESNGGSIRIEMFIDAGNVETGITRWDALGIRFFTSIPLLKRFTEELKTEFIC
ncbi:MAG TPA: hypothetical protein PKC93_03270 [Candidatus Obscuribacter sp.]|nr:hypothetical protein [Candidatus Obscuribacter sp.]